MCEVIAHGGFALHLPPDQWYVASCHVPVGHPYVFFGKTSIHILELSLRDWSKGSLSRQGKERRSRQKGPAACTGPEAEHGGMCHWTPSALERPCHRAQLVEREKTGHEKEEEVRLWRLELPETSFWQPWPEWVGSREEVGRCLQEVSHEIKDSPSKCAPLSQASLFWLLSMAAWWEYCILPSCLRHSFLLSVGNILFHELDHH